MPVVKVGAIVVSPHGPVNMVPVGRDTSFHYDASHVDFSEPCHAMSESSDAIEAAVFRRLVQHLDENRDVQNIDLMNLAGFCRNCLSKWYRAEAEERGVEIDYEDARRIVYGMPYAEWKQRYQSDADEEQRRAYAARTGKEA